MTLNLIRTGNIGLDELVTLAVQRIYGDAAVAPAEVYESADGKLEVVRAGNRTSYAIDTGRWESVSETIRGDLAVGKAPSFVEDDTGTEKRIPAKYWDCDTAWRTMATGALHRRMATGALHRWAVYLRETDGSDLIERMQHTPEEGAASDKDSRQKASVPAPTRQFGGRKKGSGSFAIKDGPFLKKMAGLLDTNEATSVWAAATQVAEAAHGNGTLESKVKRLAARYKAWKESNSV